MFLAFYVITLVLGMLGQIIVSAIAVHATLLVWARDLLQLLYMSVNSFSSLIIYTA